MQRGFSAVQSQNRIANGNIERFVLCGGPFFQLLEGPRASLIVRELLAGPRRFTELRQAVQGISAQTLTSRLRQFGASGLVVRTAYAQTPPRVVYTLTRLGEGRRGVFEALCE